MTAFDVGAHAGYFTLLLSRSVRSHGRVFAFEPEPTNIEHLRQHVRINGLTNVEIVEAAAADAGGSSRFDKTAASMMGHLSRDGSAQVQTVRLDDFPTPDIIKMDIEGAETLALLGATRILSERHTQWFIELHGDCVSTWPQDANRSRILGCMDRAVSHFC